MAKAARLLTICVIFAAFGCQDASRAPGVDGSGGDNEVVVPPPTKDCTVPNETCECAEEGQVVDCGSVERRSGDYLSCSMGRRTCTDGRWGECVGDRIVKTSANSGSSTLGLGANVKCTNPCDPYCQNQVDTGSGLMPAPGLSSDATGISLEVKEEAATSPTACTGIVISPSTQTLTVSAFRQYGLYAEFFNQRDKTVSKIPTNWPVTATRTDPTVDFNWGSGAPGPAGVPADLFSVRWTGYVLPPVSGDYTFYATTGDGARLWINDTLVINRWIDQSTTEVASSLVALSKGVAAKIQLEYFDSSGSASARLAWAASGLAKQTIPEANLLTPAGGGREFTVTPSNATFTVSVIPANCYEGTVKAAWTVDRYDLATIDGGVVQLLTPVAGDIKVHAYTSTFSSTATVNVKLVVNDVTSAPSGAAALFSGASSGADTASFLYPYNNTVLPLGMKPPLLQWANGANTESAIKIGLKFPATGAATFDWSKVMSASSNQRYAFPREIWSNFEKTAKGSTGKMTIQRIVGGVAKNPIERNVQFASGPLRGNIFYTQYGRTGGSKIMRLNPGGDSAAVQAFATDNGCPVCHSMSANGTKFATSNATWSTNAGISNVDTAGNLTVLSDFVNTGSAYSSGSNDWRGFAWAPLTPDGKYIFTANNIWGNSRQSVVGIDTTTRTVNTPLTYASGGNGTGLLADYFMNNSWTGWSFRRFDPKIDFDWLASPGSAVPADNFSVRWSGKVEPFVSETHTFEVETTAGVKLTVGGTVLINQLNYNGAATKFTGTAALTIGTKTPIILEAKDQAAQTMVKLRWSSPTTALNFVPMSQLYPDTAQRGALVTYADTSGNTLTQLEPDILANWGAAKPAPNINADYFTSTWDALIEAPLTGNLQWCLDVDEAVIFSVNGVQLLNSAVSYNNCIATPTPVVQGTKYAVRIVHTEKTSNARVRLGWQMSGTFNREDVTSARTFPPASWSPPTTGLAVTWYDTSDFGGSTIPANVTNPQGYKNYAPNLSWDFGSGRLNYGTSITSSDSWSGRFTGRLVPACTGLHEFSVYADDTVKMWLNGERVVLGTSAGTRTGAFWMDSTKTYDFKLDWSDTSSNSGIVTSWRPACNGATLFSVIPQANFLPSGDTTIAGQVRSGGDNGNGSAYWAWETPNEVGDVAVDVTSTSPGNWGLGSTIMMLPNFSPDSKKLVFVDGDSSMGAGWRKGLSTFEFDQAAKLFKNRRAIANTWPSGDVIKWPFFESDSRSVLYQTTTPGEVCCRNGWTLYGYNGPTNYFEDPGRLWSVDTQAATPNPVLLSKLNDGERVEDKNKAYQPTMLPSAASGYRWAVFTSTRPYGNILNPPAVQQNFSDTSTYTAMTNYTQLQSQLWVSAIDDTVSGSTDRSHPAFWLPNQAYNETASSGYLNERAYWVAETCRPVGTTADSVCDVDEDCCGGTSSPRTAVCRIDAPVTSPVTRHCAAAPTVATCKGVGVACSSDDDCCLGTLCSSGACAAPPPLAVYTPANFVRVYESQCQEGTTPKWRFFDWQVETPSTSSIEIYAQSVSDVSQLQTLPTAATPPAAPGAVMVTGVLKVATVSGAQLAGWTGADIGKLLDDAAPKLPHGKYLQITMRLIPDSKKLTTPLVKTWRQAYSCVAAE